MKKLINSKKEMIRAKVIIILFYIVIVIIIIFAIPMLLEVF